MGKIVALFNVAGYTAQQYSQVTKELYTAGKLTDSAYINRVVAQQTDGLLTIDVWESEEALNEFSETLVPRTVLRRHNLPYFHYSIFLRKWLKVAAVVHVFTKLKPELKWFVST